MLKSTQKSPGRSFKSLISQKTLIVPGVFNAISALAAHQAGAEALYISGGAVTNSLLGVPDIALINQLEMAEQCKNICQITPLPTIADADTGYGEAINLRRTIIEMENAGLAGVHLEDQISPKRCGHLDGKTLIPDEQMCEKIRAAKETRKDSDFQIIARTDANGVEGLSRAIERAQRYVRSGADIIFPEGLESKEQFSEFRKAIDAPLLANMTEFGKTPIISASEFSELGYEIVIFPFSAFRVMLKSLCETYDELLKTGTQKDLLGKMKTRAELYELLEYEAYNELDRLWAKTNC